MTDPFVREDVRGFLAFLETLPGPKLNELAPVEARVAARAVYSQAEVQAGNIAIASDLTIETPDGHALQARLFDARSDRGPSPALLFFHGGGWVVGGLDAYAPLCVEIARALMLPVVSVAYRLAPEYPWPAGADDAEAAARWLSANPSMLGFEVTGLVLAGESAGGNLAIITTIALRDSPAELPVVAHWAICPVTDLVTPYASAERFGEGYFLTSDMLAWFAGSYRPDPQNWRASPIVASLEALPPAVITTASLDPVRDQARAYASALVESGVPVSFYEAKGNIHGFTSFRAAIPSSQADLDVALRALAALLAN
ncbi:MAG: lipase [Proteobacteria bacterium ST_bin13]|nr:MAG: lipase [Proteobacteria bacterium ST_bin13]